MKRLLLFLVLTFSLNVFSQGTPPTLLNFRIENGQPSRVYFDSNELITGSLKKGFIISGENITGITINSGQTTGHYFKVSNSFTFWDNNTIRYDGGSDIQDIDKNDLLDFTLSYIQNNITIAEGTVKEIYVNASVSKSGNGTSESQAYKTLQEGIDDLPKKGGGKIWVKAGSIYKEGEIKKIPRGSVAKTPNVIEGYKNTPGDITSMYYDYVLNGTLKALNKAEMPLFDGGDRANGLTFCDLGSTDYYIWKNIQVTNYKVGFRAATMTGFVANNILIKDMGSLTSSNGYGFKMESNKSNSNLVRIKNSIVINATHNGIKIMGQHGLIDNSKVYCNEAQGKSDLDATTDYYYLIAGSDNIVRNSLAYKDTPNGWGHNGHGFSLKTQSNLAPVHYNLIENCTAINIYGSFQARHINCKYNVFKDSESHADISNRKSSRSDQATGGIQFLSGGSYNIFERLYIHDVDVAISWIASGEWDSDVNIQQNSIIRNCVFDNIKVAIRAYNTSAGGTSKPSGNKVYNCTFNNIDAMYRMTDDKPFVFTKNEFKNVIFNNIPVRDAELPFNGGWSYENSNFYKTWATEGGTGNVNLAPGFEDKSNGNFRLKPDSPMIDKGQNLEEVKFDFENNTRLQGNPNDIGAFEYQENSTCSAKANAGEDVTINEGESTNLTASGGDSYLWSTGDITKSISVRPTKTTSYSVLVTKNNCEDTDSVEITVNQNIVSDPPPDSVDAGEDVSICLGESITLQAKGGNSYFWSTGDTEKKISVSPTRTTTYTLNATRGGITDSDSVTVTVENCKNIIVENDLNNNIKVFPNPTTGILNVNINRPINDLDIFLININGSVIYKDKMNYSQGGLVKKLDLTKLAKGIYFVRLSNANLNTVKKIIII